jgi:hypothetical protein
MSQATREIFLVAMLAIIGVLIGLTSLLGLMRHLGR